jgi:hypothetical protein
MRNSKGQFIKGVPAHNKIWTDEKIYNELIGAVSTIHNKIGFAPVFAFFGKHEKYKTLFSAIKSNIQKPLLMYKKVLDDLGFEYPEKKSGYYLDGVVCTGFYEFVGHCFMKYWDIKVIPHPDVFENYIGDGYLSDYGLYWEHWGGLNKRNPYKQEQYCKLGFKLISTFDNDCQNKGLHWWYYHLKQVLIDNGVKINFQEPVDFDPLDCIHGKILTLKDIYLSVKSKFNETNPRLTQLDGHDRHTVLHYFGKFSSFISYCNKNFGESWIYQEKDENMTDVHYCIKLLTPLISKLKRFPTDREMVGKLKNVSRAIIKHHGGLENFKKNLYDEGEYFYLVLNILGDETPLNDRVYDFRNDNLFDWAIQYITELFGGTFPKYSYDLKKRFDDDICKYFYLAIRPNNPMTKYNSWSEFMENYFSDNSSSLKRFKDKITYEEYCKIRILLEKQKTQLKEIQKNFNVSCGTLNRILNNDKRFLDYYNQFITQFPYYVDSRVIGPKKLPIKYFAGLTHEERVDVAKLLNQYSERKLALMYSVTRGTILSIKKYRELYTS